jgi:LETM1 and EF-hand domain-containing protein 1
LNSDETIYDALQAVLGSMPEEVYHVTEADVVEEVTNKQRLELIKEQQELIESETKQETEDGIIIQVQDKKNLDDDETPDLVETTQSKEVEKEEAKEKKD